VTDTFLYLVTPAIEDAPAFAPALGATLAAARVASVLLRFAHADEATVTRGVKVLAPVIQGAGAALLLEPMADLRNIARAGADGVHVQGAGGGMMAALEAIKPERIVGVGGLRTRHDCMEAGEHEVDYIMFGEPRADGSLPDFAATLERLEWFAQVFQIPCVGYAPTLEDVPAVVATGAEFVGLGDALWKHAEGPAAAIARAEPLLKRP
jgi:thiamine-phosphate pyrophosphorylase